VDDDTDEEDAAEADDAIPMAVVQQVIASSNAVDCPDGTMKIRLPGDGWTIDAGLWYKTKVLPTPGSVA
jgi:hypothetical protein